MSGGVDISEIPGCHLLRQMSSQWGSQKLLQGLVSHELTVCLSIFNLFKLNELWPYYQKHVNQIILNGTTLWSLALWMFKLFVQISGTRTVILVLICMVSQSLHKKGLPFAWELSLENSYFCFWLALFHCLTSFSYLDYLLQLCAQFLILFHLT